MESENKLSMEVDIAGYLKQLQILAIIHFSLAVADP